MPCKSKTTGRANVLFDRGVDGFWQAQESPHEATMNSRVYNLGVNLTF